MRRERVEEKVGGVVGSEGVMVDGGLRWRWVRLRVRARRVIRWCFAEMLDGCM